MTRQEKAEQIMDALEDNDFITKFWSRGGHVRVYVTRQLSKKRQQIGYIEVKEGNELGLQLDRNRAGIRDYLESLGA